MFRQRIEDENDVLINPSDPSNDSGGAGDPPPSYDLLQDSSHSNASYINDTASFEHDPPTHDPMNAPDSGDGAEQTENLTDELFPSLVNHEYNPDGTNLIYTIFLIVNAALGAGLLNFPKAFDEAGGVVVALSIQGVLLTFIIGALIILAYCADQNLAKTIQEAMEVTAGKWGNRITSLCVIFYTLGTTITFLIIIGDQFDRALASLYGHDFCYFWYMNRSFTMTASSIIIILPMCYSNKIDFLRLPSALGVFAIFYIIGLIAYEYFLGDFIPGHIKTKPTAYTDIFLVVPDICFCYQCHVSVIPIYSCMKQRKLPQFTLASTTAIVLCALCYSGAATFGYLTFGNLVQEDILMSYSAEKPYVLIAIIAMALKTFTTYPILLFCGREAIKSLLSEFHCFQRHHDNGVTYSVVTSGRGERITRFVIVTTWFALSLFLAIVIPNIGAVIKVLGSLAAVFIFILPGLALFQFASRSDPSMYLTKTRLFMVSSFIYLSVGAFIFGVVLTQAIQYNMSASTFPQAPICYIL